MLLRFENKIYANIFNTRASAVGQRRTEVMKPTLVASLHCLLVVNVRKKIRQTDEQAPGRCFTLISMDAASVTM